MSSPRETMPASGAIPDLPIWPPRRRFRFGARAFCLAVLAVAGALAGMASTSADASAATRRYASPNGSGDCTAVKPCSIEKAVGGAASGDEVIVNPGDYRLTSPLDAVGQMTIHGVAGRPRPRLLLPADKLFRVVLYHASLRYVEIVQAHPDWAALATA